MEFWNSLRISTQVTITPEVEEGETPTPQTTNQLIEYEAGRKDRVLMRMYEDGYISDEDLQVAFME